MKRFTLFSMLILSLPALADVSMNFRIFPNGSPYDGIYPIHPPHGRSALDFGPSQEQRSLQSGAEQYYEACGSFPYRCNFLKKAGPMDYRIDAQRSYESEKNNFLRSINKDIESINTDIERLHLGQGPLTRQVVKEIDIVKLQIDQTKARQQVVLANLEQTQADYMRDLVEKVDSFMKADTSVIDDSTMPAEILEILEQFPASSDQRDMSANLEKAPFHEAADYISNRNDQLENMGHGNLAGYYQGFTQELYAYQQKNSDYVNHSKIGVSNEAAELFDINPTGNTFTGFQTIKAANLLAAIPTLTDNPYMLFQAQFAMRNLSDIDYLNEVYLGWLDTAFSIHSFSKGMGTGIVHWTYDAATAAWTLLTTPLAETAGAIANAVINYDKTWDLLINYVESNWEEMPYWSAEQWGEFTGKASLDIASMLGAIGIGKKAIDAAKASGAITRSSEKMTSQAKGIVNSAKEWDSVQSLLHVVKGNYRTAADGTRQITSGMHTKTGFNNFLQLNKQAGKDLKIKNVAEFTVEKIPAGGDVLSKTLSNGVRQLQFPRDAFANSDAYSKALVYTQSGQKLKGAKSLFPEGWDVSKIAEATNKIKEASTSVPQGSYITGVFDGVKIKVFVDESGKVLTSFPTWRQ